jgi:hypothetical protein
MADSDRTELIMMLTRAETAETRLAECEACLVAQMKETVRQNQLRHEAEARLAELKKEVERLRAFEQMYKDLCK